MNQRTGQLTQEEVVGALTSLGEDPTASRVEVIYARAVTQALPAGLRDEAIREAVSAARQAVDVLAALPDGQVFPGAVRTVEAQVNAHLRALGWSQTWMGGAADGHGHYVAKTGNSQGDFIGLWHRDWHNDALKLFPTNMPADEIACAVRDHAARMVPKRRSGPIGKHDWAIGNATEDGFAVFVDDRQLSYQPSAAAAVAYAHEIIARLIADGDYRLGDKPAGFLPPAVKHRFSPPRPSSEHFPFYEAVRRGDRVWRDDPLNNVQEWLDLERLRGDATEICRYGCKDLSLQGPDGFRYEVEADVIVAPDGTRLESADFERMRWPVESFVDDSPEFFRWYEAGGKARERPLDAAELSTYLVEQYGVSKEEADEYVLRYSGARAGDIAVWNAIRLHEQVSAVAGAPSANPGMGTLDRIQNDHAMNPAASRSPDL